MHLIGNNRQRLVHKFVEDDHIKLDRLMELYFKYQRRVQDADARIEREKDDLEEQGEVIDEAMEDEFYIRRLDAGLHHVRVLLLRCRLHQTKGIDSTRTTWGFNETDQASYEGICWSYW